MGGRIFDGILALIALIFAIWTVSYSNIVIIIATALILAHALTHALGWCNCCCRHMKGDMNQMPKKSAKAKK
jgi:hypothetical protein